MTMNVHSLNWRLTASTRAHPNRKSVNARCATSLVASSSGLISRGEARRGSEDCTALSSESDTRLAAQQKPAGVLSENLIRRGIRVVRQYYRMRPDPTDERKPEVGSIPDPMANL